MKGFILSAFIIWRVFLFVVSYVATFFLAFKPRFPYSDIYLIPTGLPSWVWSFANFDGVHYLTIAKMGYSAQFTQVFFPLFPILLGLWQKILFPISPLVSGLIFSNLVFLATLIVFYKLLAFDHKNQEIIWIILFSLFFPASFFYGSLYTEGLFLFLTFSTFYLARREKWFLASVMAALSSATRVVGIFLVPALIYEFYKSLKTRKSRKFTQFLMSPVLLIAPLGLLVYMIYLQIFFSDALYFWHSQPVFGAAREGSSIVFLPQVFWRYIKIFLSVPINQLSFWTSMSEFITTIFGIIVLIFAHKKKIRLSYLVFSWPALLLPTLTGTLSSMPRYILIIFPVFMVLGLVKSKPIKLFVLTVFLICLSIFTVLFTRGYWIS